jgi:acyl-CoA reductase-like NAD-dependent aldehyde dehydrogenase
MNFESRNPATGQLLAVYPEHDKVEINTRLQRAGDGWRGWSRTPLEVRTAFLTRLAKLLEERAEAYGRLITAEMGKPLRDAVTEIKKSALAARHFAEARCRGRLKRWKLWCAITVINSFGRTYQASENPTKE